MSKQRGFSLIEIAIVLIILVLIVVGVGYLANRKATEIPRADAPSANSYLLNAYRYDLIVTTWIDPETGWRCLFVAGSGKGGLTCRSTNGR